MTTYTVAKIAQSLGLTAQGEGSLVIAGLAEPATAGAGDLALASNVKYADDLAKGDARAALLWQDADWQALGLEAAILVDRPRFAMAQTTQMFDHAWRGGQGVHPTAWVDPTAQVVPDAVIGAFTSIGAGAVIGADAVIGAHVSIADGVQIGQGATLRDGVRIMHNVRIGDGFVAQPNVVIGGDGFSFVTAEVSVAETVRETLGDQGDSQSQPYSRIHSLGGVIIGDAVEIGAGSCVDAGTIRATRIGDGTKLDNLVQVGHNVTIGRDCLLCGMVGIAGSSDIGNNVILGGRVGVTDNIFVGDRVVAGINSVLMSNVPAGRVMLGYPAVQMKSHVEIYKHQRRLPKLARDVTELKKTVSNPPATD